MLPPTNKRKIDESEPTYAIRQPTQTPTLPSIVLLWAKCHFNHEQ